eukprot:Skav220314  [mRNA]  locus=scaffold5951:6464:6911:+ [translate_table: standard]
MLENASPEAPELPGLAPLPNAFKAAITAFSSPLRGADKTCKSSLLHPAHPLKLIGTSHRIQAMVIPRC